MQVDGLIQNMAVKTPPPVISSIVNEAMVKVSFVYADQWVKDPNVFLKAFIGLQSVRTNCAWIRSAYKYTGAFADCQASGKDFSEYANKQPVGEKWKPVLADILLIIYSIVKK